MCAERGRGPVLAASEEMEMATPAQGRQVCHELFHATEVTMGGLGEKHQLHPSSELQSAAQSSVSVLP